MGIWPCFHVDRRPVSLLVCWFVRLFIILGMLLRELTCRNRNAHYPPHKHSGVTTHLILNGSLTYAYPNDPEASKETLHVGGRWDVDANKVHEVWVGKEGCTYVIGE
jgi:hypothetical protein